ncbi:hypothetical protein E2C01_080089 [Portunus trituberculatus]|uniref:Uncharacterized protein n=1 Tax=Portunus trituberculatus TaxID=210409 RepID=A0A5B7IL91_PORTR|nr:hypothetical protein [Portunus trituberculatus]
MQKNDPLSVQVSSRLSEDCEKEQLSISELSLNAMKLSTASEHPSQESDSKKSRKIEKKLEVLNRYAMGEDLGDCPCDGTEGEDVAYH